MNKTYRYPRFQLHLSVLGTVLFGAGTVACPVIAIFAPRDEAPGAGVFWWLTIPYLLFLGFFDWVLWTTVKCRLEVSDNSVILVGPRRTRQIRFQDLTSAQWRRSIWSGSNLVLSTASDEVVVCFNHYGWRKLEDLKELVRFFRDTIPNHLQKDWDGSACEMQLHVEPLLFE